MVSLSAASGASELVASVFGVMSFFLGVVGDSVKFDCARKIESI